MSRPIGMDFAVAMDTESDQVFFSILSLVAASENVVHLEIRESSADLTAPTIPLQYLLAQSSIGIRV